MSDPIYIVDSVTKSPVRVEPASFAEIGVRERRDLESWVVAHPELLGEPLLTVSSEFDGFDKSSKRLDVLAMDQEGVLVVVELKLDVEGSYADLQAIRYAAFCSTMTMQDVVDLLSRRRAISKDEAEKALLEFLGIDELPELGDRPRVILAAGAIDDQEITSCVLWLRRFGVDISCIEIAPYRLSDGTVVLVPKTIIPLPETREYTVQVEKKEASKVERSRSHAEEAKLWTLVKADFNRLECPLKVGMNSNQQWLVVRGGTDAAHYAWWWMKREQTVRIGIGFRSKNASENDRLMGMFRADKENLAEAVGLPIQFQDDWGPVTRRVYASVPYDGTQPLEEVAKDSARCMGKLIEATLSILVSQGIHSR